jgi:hypothetical protein
VYLVAYLTCHTMQKKIVTLINHSNAAPHFDMANEILSHFYKSLTDATKVVG